MFNLFDEEGEPFTKGAKFRFLVEKVNHQELQTVIEALRVRGSFEVGRNTTFTKAANILAASAASLLETFSKSRISGLSLPGTGVTSDKSIYRQGKIYTGYYKNFQNLSKEDREKVIAEREKLKVKKGSSIKKNNRSVSSTETGREVASVRKKLKKANRKIYALERSHNEESDASSDEENPSHNAGTSFGDRNEKRDKKRSS